MYSFLWLLYFAVSLLQHPAHCIPQGIAFSFFDILGLLETHNCQTGEIITGTQASEFLPSAAPELAGPENASPSGCGGCYLVADVAGEHDAWTK